MPRGIEWLWDLERLLPPGNVRTVFDVGANVGQTTRAVLRAFPTAAVHAFEPVRSTFESLQAAVGGDPRVRVNHGAVSDHTGTVHIQVEAESYTSHIVSDFATGAATIESVAAETLDRYCERHLVERIEILKSDTEGHDLQVLMGARRLFEQGRIDWVFVEVTFEPQNPEQSAFGPIDDWLQLHGMVPWSFYDHCYTHGGRRLLFCNVLFGRRVAG
jgi:FkbM family methyltransferase